VPRAALVPVETIRAFLQAQGLQIPAAGTQDAGAAVQRIICVRK
jgi:hypothetical protein